MHHKALAAHFKKAAAHHEKMADHHEKCMKAHEAHAEVHEEHMGKGGDEQYHKKSAQFHKSMAGHHDKLHKSHAAHAEHLHKVCEACTEEDHKKVAKLLELEEGELEDMSKVVDPTPTPAAVAAVPAVAATPAAGAVVDPATGASFDFNQTIQKALDQKTTEAVNTAFQRVLNSEDFGKMVDQNISKLMLEKLGQTTVDTTIRTYPIPRPGDKVIKTGNGGSVGVDPTIAHLVSFD